MIPIFAKTNALMTKFEIEEKIVAMLKTVFDPEIPVR
jgi:metal-sulfur cluster biosynthetic enzyme